MNFSTRIILLVLPLCFLAACSPENPGPESGKTSKAQVARKYQTVDEVPEIVRTQAVVFAKKLEQDIGNGDSAAIKAAFDGSAIVDGICEGVTGSSLRLLQFKTGMKQGIQKSLDQVAEVWSEAEVKFKGLAVYQGNLAARFRVIAASGGVSMMDMVLRTNKQGRLAIANFCNHTMGYDLVEQTRQVAAPMLADIDKSFLERLLNKPGMKPEDFKGFGQLAEKLRSGDMQGVVATYNSLPDQLRDTLAAACIYITALQRSDDTNAYKHALQEAAVRFDSPSFKFMLVDLYAMEGNHGKAADCVDAFMKVVGPDAALLALKSSLLKSKGDIPLARKTLQQAFELEPDCVYAHSTGLDVLLADRDFKAVRDSIQFLESNASYDFKGHLTDSAWDEFKKAPESKPWR
jgi:tetratricopeptide (TPR) repeat protein